MSVAPPTLRSIHLTRHGQSSANAGGITLPHASIPLTELGWRQAHALAQLLPAQPAHILCSKFSRAQDTASPYAARTGLRPLVHPLLHEFDAIDPDLLAGMTGAERKPIAAEFWETGDPHLRKGPQAETFAEFTSRVRRFLAHDLPLLPDGSVLFGHGQWIGMAAWLLLGFDPLAEGGMRRFRRFQMGLPMPNAAVYVLQELAPGQWRLQADAASMARLADVA